MNREADDEAEAPAFAIRLCPICWLGCLDGADWYQHMQEKHPAAKVFTLHPEGHA